SLAIAGEQRSIRLVPLRPLPAGRLEEHGAQGPLALVKRALPHIAVRGPLLAGMYDAIGLVESLGGARLHMRAGALVRVEARDIGAAGVDLRETGGHPLRDGGGDGGRP